MKQILTFIFCINLTLSVWAQAQKGHVVVDSLYSKNLGNHFGENPKRAISVYLPPNYESTDRHYPVLYFLHGFGGDHQKIYVLEDLLNDAIKNNKIKPFIMVISNQKTTYGGSWYSNSDVFGNWEDFTAYDVVDYIDKNFRTLAKKESRGITGHSMGGFGALKLAMHHPEIFSCVYALSPGGIAIVREYGPNSDTYQELANIHSIEDLRKNKFCKLAVAFAKSWSPNPNNPPFYCDIPFEYQNERLIVNQDVLKKWYANMPFYMIDENLDNLKKLKAIKLDWGRNAGDRFTIQCELFSQKLENVGIEHFAEEYIGTHTSGIYTKEGRVPNQMLPFFNDYLEFEDE